MNKLISILITITVFLQVAILPVQASENYLVIEEIDFDSDIELISSSANEDGIRIEKLKEDFGYSYILKSAETDSAFVQFGRKTSAFKNGKLLLEYDFMFSNANAVYYLVHLRSTAPDGTVKHNRDCYIKNGMCGNMELEKGNWYHLRYELDVDKKRSVFYINSTEAGYNDNVSIESDFNAWRISIQDADAELAIDNMKLSKITEKASIESVDYYAGNETILGENEIGEELFAVEVNFGRAIDFNSIQTDSVVVYKDGKLMNDGYYVRGDIENAKCVLIYFADSIENKRLYNIDFSGLTDEWGLNLMENSRIEFAIDSPTYKNASYCIYNYDGEKIEDTNKISDGDKVRLAVDFENKYEDAWKPCIFVFAVYGEDGQIKDVITEEVTVNPYTPTVSITTDFITISNTDGEKLTYKGFLWEKETLSPKLEQFVSQQKVVEKVGTLSVDLSGLAEYAEDEIVNPSEYFSGYADVKKKFEDTVAFVVDSDKIYTKGKKYISGIKPIYENGEIWVSQRFLEALFLRCFSNARDVDGTKCVSLKSAAEQMSLYYSDSYKGLGIIAEKPVNVKLSTNLADVKKLIRYITFDRPSRETLRSRLVDVSNPRTLATNKVFNDLIKSDDATIKFISNSIAREAEALLKEETPIITPQSSPPVGAEYSSIMKLYWLYKTTGERRYADKAIEHAVRMSNWEHWLCNGFLATSYDLLTCGYVYDLFKNEMTNEQKETIQNGIYEKGILPAREHYYGRGESNWPLRLTNWNIVCNTGVIVGALAICNDYESDICFDVLEKALVSLEYAMLECAPDGGWFEGVGYSGYTMNYLTLGLQALTTAFGDTFGLTDAPGFLKYGYFTYYMTATEDKVNLHDEIRGRNGLSSTSSHWIANYTDDSMLRTMRMNWIKNIDGGKPSFLDLLWYQPNSTGLHIDAPLDRNFSFAEMATSRSSWDGDATFLSVHAGDNGCSHGQMDIGQFELEVDGTRFALDMGRDDYALPNYFYFGSTREEYYVNRAEGHNVYVINPDETPGQYYYASSTVETVSEKPDGVIYTVDMTPAYIGQVKKATRGYMLTNNRKVFVMQDEIIPKKSGDEYYWFWHTDAEITIDESDNSHVTLTKNGIDLNLYFKSNIDFAVSSGKSLPLPTSPEGEGEQLKMYGTVNKITVRFTSGTDDINFRVIAVPEGTEYSPSREISPITEWSIADGIRSDRYTIVDGIVSGVPEGIDSEEFLSHIYTGDMAKELYLNGKIYTGETLSGNVILEIVDDGMVYKYEIEYTNPAYITVCEPSINNHSETLYSTTTNKQMFSDLSVYFGAEENGKKVWMKGEDSDETGGKAIHIASTADTTAATQIQMFKDFGTSNKITNGEVKISFDYKADNYNTTAKFQGRFDNQPRELLNFNTDGTITAFGKIVGEYEAGDWTNVEVSINPGINNLYRIHINGELAVKGSAAWLRYKVPMTQIKLMALAEEGKEMSVWFDNIKAEKINQ